jgi:hypothetical protein
MGAVLPFRRRRPSRPLTLLQQLRRSPTFAPFIRSERTVTVPKVSLDLTPKPTTKIKVEAKPVNRPDVTALLEDRQIVAAKLSQLDAKKRALDAEILKTIKKITKSDDGAIQTADYFVSTVNATNNYVDPQMLLKLGVKASIIKKATKTTPYAYPRITKKKIADPSNLLRSDDDE